MPRWFASSRRRGTVSKALEKSNIATSTRPPASSDDNKSFVVSRSCCVSHQLCWNLVILLCKSKWFKMCFTMIYSNILHEIDDKETGL